MEKERTSDSTKLQRPASYNRIENVMGTTGKLTPQAVEFEEAVLGGLMIDSESVSVILGTLTFQMFYKEAHQHIFRAIAQCLPAETKTLKREMNGSIHHCMNLIFISPNFPHIYWQFCDRLRSEAIP